MSLLLSLLGAVAAAAVLAVTVAVPALRRRDHRCTEQTRPRTCDRCAAVLRGEDRGGHLVCGCGRVSPHLAGADLLAWRAVHHGEELPPLPGAPVPAPAPRSTTRGRAAAEAEERVRHALAEELGETRRRMIDRARRRPDPITPQLLREAEEFGVPRPAAPDAQAAGGTGEPGDPAGSRGAGAVAGAEGGEPGRRA